MVRPSFAVRWIRATLISSRSSGFLGVGRGHEAHCDVSRLSYRQSPTQRTTTQGRGLSAMSVSGFHLHRSPVY